MTGDTIHLVHMAATYSRSIDAALRGFAFNGTVDAEYFGSQLARKLDSLEALHNSLYVAGLVPASVWNDASYSALVYNNAITPPTSVSLHRRTALPPNVPPSLLLSPPPTSGRQENEPA